LTREDSKYLCILSISMKFFYILLIFFFSFANLFSETIYVGIYIVNMGKFDVSSGNFTADFYLTLKTKSKPKYPLDSFEFMNGRATHIEKILSEENKIQYRILASLSSPVDLRNFPFDEQILSIIIENKNYTTDQVKYVFVEKETGIDKSISFIGWKLKGWNVKETNHEYEVFNEVYSLARMNLILEKIIWNAFFKTFLPVLIIVFLVICSFIMDVDKIKDRIGICTSCLVASVMFHLSISNQIPPVSYITIADKFMLLTYLTLMLCVILNVWILQLIQAEHESATKKIHRYSRNGMFVILPIIYISFFIYSFYVSR
jgi:hypothetical protein